MTTAIQSVTLNDDEGDTDSCDDNNLRRVHRVNAEDVDEPEESSPAPAPIKGGEGEVVRLSHVRSIEVKETAISGAESPHSSNRRDFHGRYLKGVDPMDNGDRLDRDSEVSDCAPMDVIEKSPYEPSLNAEKAVKLFSDMKSLLAESNNDDYRSVSPQATKIFGPTNAWCLVKANGKRSFLVLRKKLFIPVILVPTHLFYLFF
jgi:hypothetical protein